MDQGLGIDVDARASGERPWSGLRQLAVAIVAVMALLAVDVFVEGGSLGAPVGAQDEAEETFDPASAREVPPLESPEIADEAPADEDFYPNPSGSDGWEPGGFVEGESTVVESETTETELVYENPDGSFTAELAASPVRFQDESGDWQDYDTDLAREGGELVPASAPEGEAIAPVANEDAIVTSQTDVGPVTLTVPDVEPVTAEVDGDVVTFPGAVDGASDLVVALVPEGFETTVVVPDAGEASTYDQVLTVPEGVVARAGGPGVELVDPTGAIIGTYGSGIAYDAAPRPAEAEVRTELVGQAGSEVTVRISVDDAWFSDPDREFPVEIDPTFQTWTSEAGALDTYVQSNIVNTPQSSATELKVGPVYGDTSIVRRALLRFNTSSIEGAGKTVLSANIAMYNHASPSCTTRSVQIRSLSGSFNASTVWSNQPGFGATSITSQAFAHGYTGCAAAVEEIDITDLAQKWVDGWGNNGIAVKAVSETDNLAGKGFYSAESGFGPVLTVNYTRTPTSATLNAPADAAKLPTTTPTLTVNPGSDPDGDPLQYWYTVATEPDGISGTLVSSGWKTGSGNTSWTVPPGSLEDGTTYYWSAYTWDGVGAWVLSSVRSFTVDLRLGDTGVWPFDDYGPAKVNLTTGNLVVNTASPSFSTVAGDMGLSYTYNARAEAINGLTGAYTDVSLSPTTHRPLAGQEPSVVRKDPVVSFNWGSGKPASQLSADNFYGKWTGFVTAPYDGGYRFGGTCDDGMRIEVNGNVLDKWTGCGTSPVWSAAFTLTAGQVVPIEVEYWEGTGAADINLMVRHPFTDAKGINVPSSWLSTKASTLPTGWTVSADLDGTIAYRSVDKTVSAITFTDTEGGAHRYTWNATKNAWTPPEGEYGTVGTAANGAVTLIDEDGQTYVFGTDGRLASVTSALDDGGQASLQYTWSGTPVRLTAITDPVSGRAITLHYSGDSTCTSASGFSTAPPNMLCAADYNAFSSGRTQIRYNSNGQVARIDDPGGKVTDFEYDTQGRLSAVRDPLGADAVAAGVRTDVAQTRTDITYASATSTKVASITLPAPLASEARPAHTYTYVNATTTDIGAAGLTSTTGRLRRVEFDARGRTTKDIDQAGRTDFQKWDDQDRIVSTWNTSTNLKSTSVYDGRGLLTDSWGPAPITWWSAADATGAPASNVAATPHSTTAYDGGISGLAATWWNNTTWSGTPAVRSTGINPALQETTMSWGSGSPAGVSAADFSGRITGWLKFDNTSPWTIGVSSLRGTIKVTIDNTLVVDAANTNPSVASGTYTPTTTGWKAVSIDYANPTGDASFGLQWKQGAGSWGYPPLSNQSSGYGLATEAVNADGEVTRTSYASTANGIDPKMGLAVTVTTDPLGLALIQKTEYEAPGTGFLRPTGRQLPTGAASAVTRTYWGNSATANSPCPGGPTSVNQGGAQRLVTSADPDAAGPQVSIARETIYDQAGRAAATRVVADGANWTCTTYDARGRVLTTTVPALTDRDGRVTTYSYAVAGNPLATDVSDAVGSGSTRTVRTTVDLLGRTRSYVDAWGNTTTTAYDQVGRVSSVNSLVGSRTYTYDNEGNEGPTVLDGTTLATPSYDTAGRLSSASFANGSSLDTIGRDALGRETSQAWRGTGSVVLTSDQVAISVGGNITDQTVDGQAGDIAGPDFVYDAAGRLTRAVTPAVDASGAWSIITDQFGYGTASGSCSGASVATAGRNTNMTSRTRNGGTPTTYCYDAADRLISTSQPGVGAVGYDTHGNTTDIWGETRSYDASDRHLETVDGSATIAYLRDGTGRLISRSTAGSDVRYGYTAEGDTADFVTNVAGTLLERYIGLPGGAMVTIAGSSEIWSYPNLHGDVAALADASGTKQGVTRTYDSYGTVTSDIADTSTGDLDFGWLGEHRRPTEHETGFADTIEMGARQYDPVLGRFLEVDPIEGGSANDYDYVHGDPINNLDLDGTRCWLGKNPNGSCRGSGPISRGLRRAVGGGLGKGAVSILAGRACGPAGFVCGIVAGNLYNKYLRRSYERYATWGGRTVWAAGRWGGRRYMRYYRWRRSGWRRWVP